MNKIIFLFGHRQQHGKNTAAAMLEGYLKEKGIAYTNTYFAKKLKMICAEKYGLDFTKMEDNEYKMSCPPWLEKKTIYWDVENKREVPHWVFMDPGQLKIEQITKKRTVRDVLLEEGQSSRAIWYDIWASGVYQEIEKYGTPIGIVSDFRYPNEYTYSQKKKLDYKVVKILVHRPDGIFRSDGADDLIPDVDEKYWDHVIINNNSPQWMENMKSHILTIAGTYGL
jgi:hypothetical protein